MSRLACGRTLTVWYIKAMLLSSSEASIMRNASQSKFYFQLKETQTQVHQGGYHLICVIMALLKLADLTDEITIHVQLYINLCLMQLSQELHCGGEKNKTMSSLRFG